MNTEISNNVQEWLPGHDCRKLLNMEQRRIYSKAPITEAIIDLRVQPRDELTMEELEGVRFGEEIAYPRSNTIYQTDGTITVQDGIPPSATAQQQLLGYRFTSEDGKAIWDFFEKLHVRKNEVFEACITNKTRRLF